MAQLVLRATRRVVPAPAPPAAATCGRRCTTPVVLTPRPGEADVARWEDDGGAVLRSDDARRHVQGAVS